MKNSQEITSVIDATVLYLKENETNNIKEKLLTERKKRKKEGSVFAWIGTAGLLFSFLPFVFSESSMFVPSMMIGGVLCLAFLLVGGPKSRQAFSKRQAIENYLRAMAVAEQLKKGDLCVKCGTVLPRGTSQCSVCNSKTVFSKPSSLIAALEHTDAKDLSEFDKKFNVSFE